jgi:hypothetical protein
LKNNGSKGGLGFELIDYEIVKKAGDNSVMIVPFQPDDTGRIGMMV